MDSQPTRRRYRSELRAAQAAETRRLVVDAAMRLFARQGYPATTFAQIADEAEVGADGAEARTQDGHPVGRRRAGVLWGGGETDFFATEVGRAMLDIRDPYTLATSVGDAMLAINGPSAAVWMTFVGAAQGDEELRGFHAESLARIRAQVERFLGFVDERGWLRHDVPFNALVEAFCVITSVESLRPLRHR